MVFLLTLALFQGRWKWGARPPEMGIVPLALRHWILAVLVILAVSVMIWPIIGLHLAQYVGMGMAITRHLTHWHRIFWPEIFVCNAKFKVEIIWKNTNRGLYWRECGIFIEDFFFQNWNSKFYVKHSWFWFKTTYQ